MRQKKRGKIKLQPFFGEAIEADWVQLQISPFIKDEEFSDVYITVDCAVIDHSNENMILTADVLARLEALELCERSNDIVSCNAVDVPSDSDTVVKTLLPSSDDTMPNIDQHRADVIEESVDCDGVLSDSVGDDNESEMGITHGEIFTNDTASVQQVAEEQQSDDTLKGCFKLARAGKGGFEIHDNLLYHRKTVVGDTFLQLVVPVSRRKHVLELGHDVFGGHMALQRTKQRIEFTFYWPTLLEDCREYVRTCHVCQVKKRKTRRDQIPITPIQRSDRVFDHMFVDCLGPLFSGEGTKPKYNYALIAVDSFSLFPFCVPLKTLQAKAVCEALMSIWEFTGVSSYISTDMRTNLLAS